MKEQNQNMRTFCALLGEAQTVMQQLATHLHITSDVAKFELEHPGTRDKPMQSRSEENLSQRQETSENGPAVTTLFRRGEEPGRVTVGTQAEFDDDEEEEEEEEEEENTPDSIYTICDDCGNANGQHEAAVALIKGPDCDSSQSELEILDGFGKMRVAEKLFNNYDLGTISERTEASTLSSKSKDANSGTDEKPLVGRDSNKQAKPLDKTTDGINLSDISDSPKIPETIQKERVNEEDGAKNDQKSLGRSTRNRLSVQIMPPIDIKRSLVTQKIPEIIITAAESVPQLSVLNSNVAYEIVKHPSTDAESLQLVDSKVSQLDLKNNPSLSRELQPPKQIEETDEPVATTTKSLIQANKIIRSDSFKRSSSRTEQTKSKVSTESIPQPTLVAKARRSSAKKIGASSGNADNYSGTSSDCTFKKTNEEEPAVLSTNLSTVFRNEDFNDDSQSDSFIFDDADGQPSRSTINSSKSNETSDAKPQDHVDDLVEDPNPTTSFKFHQVREDESESELVAEVDDEIDSEDVMDAHNTFINPDTQPMFSLHPSEIFKIDWNNVKKPQQNAATSPLVPSKIPPEFCATKSTQCDEIMDDHDLSDHAITVLKDCAFKWDTSQTCSRTTLDGNEPQIQRESHGRDLPPTWIDHQAPQMAVVEVVQTPHWNNKGLFRRPIQQPPTKNPSIPRIFSAGLARSGSIRKSSLVPRLDGTTPNNQPVDWYQVKPATEQCNLLQSSHTLQQIDQDVANKMKEAALRITTGSLHSENTEDVIFEIDRESLRLESQHLMQTIEDEGLASGITRQIKIINNKDLGSKNKSQIGGEDVADQDVAMSTSLRSISEVLLDSHQYDNQSFYSAAVGEDSPVRKEEGEVTPNTSCCVKFRWKSPRKEDKSARVKSRQLSTEPKRSSLAKNMGHRGSFDKGSQLMQRKSVTIAEPASVLTPSTEKLRRRLPRESASPVGPTEAHQFKKDDFTIARNSPRQSNVLTVFEDQNTSHFLNPIRTSSGAWAPVKQSNQDTKVETPELANGGSGQTSKELMKDDTKGNIDPVTPIVDVEHPEVFIRETDYTETNPSSIFLKHKLCKRNCDSASSETTTTSSSVTEETISEGEVKCRSVGEVHRRSHPKGFKLLQYFKTHPEALLKYEFADPGLKVERQKQFNSNWVAYYVSRSPSPELSTTESSVGRVE